MVSKMTTKIQQLNQQIQLLTASKNKEITELKTAHEEQLKTAAQNAQKAGAVVVADKRIESIQSELAEMQRAYQLLKIENQNIKKSGDNVPATKLNKTFGLMLQTIDRAQRIIKALKEEPAVKVAEDANQQNVGQKRQRTD